MGFFSDFFSKDKDKDKDKDKKKSPTPSRAGSLAASDADALAVAGSGAATPRAPRAFEDDMDDANENPQALPPPPPGSDAGSVRASAPASAKQSPSMRPQPPPGYGVPVMMAGRDSSQSPAIVIPATPPGGPQQLPPGAYLGPPPIQYANQGPGGSASSSRSSSVNTTGGKVVRMPPGARPQAGGAPAAGAPAVGGGGAVPPQGMAGKKIIVPGGRPPIRVRSGSIGSSVAGSDAAQMYAQSSAGAATVINPAQGGQQVMVTGPGGQQYLQAPVAVAAPSSEGSQGGTPPALMYMQAGGGPPPGHYGQPRVVSSSVVSGGSGSGVAVAPGHTTPMPSKDGASLAGGALTQEQSQGEGQAEIGPEASASGVIVAVDGAPAIAVAADDDDDDNAAMTGAMTAGDDGDQTAPGETYASAPAPATVDDDDDSGSSCDFVEEGGGGAGAGDADQTMDDNTESLAFVEDAGSASAKSPPSSQLPGGKSKKTPPPAPTTPKQRRGQQQKLSGRGIKATGSSSSATGAVPLSTPLKRRTTAAPTTPEGASTRGVRPPLPHHVAGTRSFDEDHDDAVSESTVAPMTPHHWTLGGGVNGGGVGDTAASSLSRPSDIPSMVGGLGGLGLGAAGDTDSALTGSAATFPGGANGGGQAGDQHGGGGGAVPESLQAGNIVDRFQSLLAQEQFCGKVRRIHNIRLRSASVSSPGGANIVAQQSNAGGHSPVLFAAYVVSTSNEAESLISGGFTGHTNPPLQFTNSVQLQRHHSRPSPTSTDARPERCTTFALCHLSAQRPRYVASMTDAMSQLKRQSGADLCHVTETNMIVVGTLSQARVVALLDVTWLPFDDQPAPRCPTHNVDLQLFDPASGQMLCALCTANDVTRRGDCVVLSDMFSPAANRASAASLASAAKKMQRGLTMRVQAHAALSAAADRRRTDVALQLRLVQEALDAKRTALLKEIAEAEAIEAAEVTRAIVEAQAEFTQIKNAASYLQTAADTGKAPSTFTQLAAVAGALSKAAKVGGAGAAQSMGSSSPAGHQTRASLNDSSMDQSFVVANTHAFDDMRVSVEPTLRAVAEIDFGMSDGSMMYPSNSAGIGGGAGGMMSGGSHHSSPFRGGRTPTRTMRTPTRPHSGPPGHRNGRSPIASRRTPIRTSTPSGPSYQYNTDDSAASASATMPGSTAAGQRHGGGGRSRRGINARADANRDDINALFPTADTIRGSPARIRGGTPTAAGVGAAFIGQERGSKGPRRNAAGSSSSGRGVRGAGGARPDPFNRRGLPAAGRRLPSSPSPPRGHDRRGGSAAFRQGGGMGGDLHGSMNDSRRGGGNGSIMMNTSGRDDSGMRGSPVAVDTAPGVGGDPVSTQDVDLSPMLDGQLKGTTIEWRVRVDEPGEWFAVGVVVGTAPRGDLRHMFLPPAHCPRVLRVRVTVAPHGHAKVSVHDPHGQQLDDGKISHWLPSRPAVPQLCMSATTEAMFLDEPRYW